MKKWGRVLVTAFFLFTLFFSSSQNASAAKIIEDPITWQWPATMKTEIVPQFTFTTAPYDWMQLLSNGLKTDSPGKICHEFKKGLYGWTAYIYQLVEGKWSKLVSTTGWVPSEEGVHMVCAEAPQAGTYAVFGYFDPAKAPVQEDPDVCPSEWEVHFWYHSDYHEWDEGWSLEIYLGENSEDFPVGQKVTYSIIGPYPVPGLEFLPVSGTTLSWDDSDIYATFTDAILDEDLSYEFPYHAGYKIRVETGGSVCVLDWDTSAVY